LLSRPPPCPPLFPYTTLFRSSLLMDGSQKALKEALSAVEEVPSSVQQAPKHIRGRAGAVRERVFSPTNEENKVVEEYLKEAGLRSEEHTSELQSRENLVCRLL